MDFPHLEELLVTGHKYRNVLLAMIPVRLKPILAHMTPRYGIQGKESVGTATNQAQLRPYRPAKDATFTGDITLRELETYLGDVVEEFDPNLLWSTIYGSTVGTKPDKAKIALEMAARMVDSVGENLALSIFKAKRNASGNTTMDLFNGFETIIEKDKAEGDIAEAKGNLVNLGALSSVNILDQLDRFFFSSHEVLQEQRTKLFMPRDIYNLYNKAYQAEHGALPYNREYKKTFLEGSDDRCQLVPMSGMTGTRMILTTKQNMLVGMDQTGQKEKVEIRRPDNPKVVQLFMLAYFGVQYEHIHERKFCVGEFTAPEPDPNTED